MVAGGDLINWQQGLRSAGSDPCWALKGWSLQH